MDDAVARRLAGKSKASDTVPPNSKKSRIVTHIEQGQGEASLASGHVAAAAGGSRAQQRNSLGGSYKLPLPNVHAAIAAVVSSGLPVRQMEVTLVNPEQVLRPVPRTPSGATRAIALDEQYADDPSWGQMLPVEVEIEVARTCSFLVEQKKRMEALENDLQRKWLEVGAPPACLCCLCFLLWHPSQGPPISPLLCRLKSFASRQRSMTASA